MDPSSSLAVAAGSWGVMMAVAPALQIRAILRTRSSANVSTGYLWVLVVGFVLWLAYGIAIANAALIVTNAVALTVNAALVAVVLRFRPGAEAAAAEA